MIGALGVHCLWRSPSKSDERLMNECGAVSIVRLSNVATNSGLTELTALRCILREARVSSSCLCCLAMLPSADVRYICIRSAPKCDLQEYGNFHRFLNTSSRSRMELLFPDGGSRIQMAKRTVTVIRSQSRQNSLIMRNFS